MKSVSECRKKGYVLKNGWKQDFLLLNLNNMAWCLCDECDYSKECKYYRKVVVCPYMVKEENNNINTKENG